MNSALLVPIALLVVVFAGAGYVAPRSAAVAYVFFFLLTGSLSQEYEFLLSVRDWITIGLFLSVLCYEMAQRPRLAMPVSWPDRLLGVYFAVILLLPLFTNPSTLTNVRFLAPLLLPVKIWVVYRILRSLILRASRRERQEPLQVADSVFQAFLAAGLVAAIVAVLRYLPIAPVQGFIEETWPIISNNQHVPIQRWGRLWATMSGTNGSGIFFGFCAVISTEAVPTVVEGS